MAVLLQSLVSTLCFLSRCNGWPSERRDTEVVILLLVSGFAAHPNLLDTDEAGT